MATSILSPDTVGIAPRPELKDYVSLYLAKLARIRCRTLSSAADESDEQFYEAFFLKKDLDARFYDHRRLVRNETLGAFLADNVPSGSCILDVGCGVGEVLSAIPASYVLSGLEYVQSNVEQASRLLGDRARIIRGDIYDMEFQTGSQDVCTCLEVLEHIEDDARAVREIARVLKPGGYLLAAVPYTYYWPQYKSLIGHFRHYTRDSFTSLCEENGLEVIDYLPNYPNWHHAYARRYCAVRLQAILFGWAFQSSSVYDFKWPWSRNRSIEKVANRLKRIKSADENLDYRSLQTSTFVVARKPQV